MKKETYFKMAFAASMMMGVANVDAQKIDFPKISGFINARYQYSDEAGQVTGFDIRRVRLSADGELSKSVDYKVQAEYETTVKILDAYLRWKIDPAFNIQLGQFKAPFSQESYYSPAALLTIDNSVVVSKLNGYNDLSGIKSNGRDVGFIFYGGILHQPAGFDLISYKVGLFNGNGINMAAKKNDKDVAGIIYVNPAKQLTLSVGHYEGSYGEQGNTHVRNRTSAGAEYKDKQLILRSEYIQGNTAGQKSNGVYAEAAYFVTDKIQPLVSYDYFKANKDINVSQNDYQVGVNYLPLKNLRLQAAYTHKETTGSKAVNYVAAQVFVKF